MKTFCDENGYFHIVYKTTIIKTGQYYIGKHSTKIIEDGYFGSGVIISNYIAKHGVIGLKREILILASNKKLLTYYETKLLFQYEVLENPDKWFNDNIEGRYFRKDFT